MGCVDLVVAARAYFVRRVSGQGTLKERYMPQARKCIWASIGGRKGKESKCKSEKGGKNEKSLGEIYKREGKRGSDPGTEIIKKTKKKSRRLRGF